MTPPPPTSGIEQERQVMEAAMTECRRQLRDARRNRDELATDLLEDELNDLIDRYALLIPATEATEVTDA